MSKQQESAYLHAVNAVARGGVIGFPTESVYSLGCDPAQKSAVERLCTIKNRPIEKGFILVAADFSHLRSWLQPLAPHLLARAQATWPGPVTWVIPCLPSVPEWVRGAHNSIAVRISAHPHVQRLCALLARPLISTSANVTGADPVVDVQSFKDMFADQVDAVISGEVGTLSKPTPIYDIMTGSVLREG